MKITILGAGAFGTGVAHVCSHVQNARVCLWARNKQLSDTINKEGYNMKYFPKYHFKPNVFSTSDMTKALNGADMVKPLFRSFIAYLLRPYPTKLTKITKTSLKSMYPLFHAAKEW